jgi:hypothetical protein
MKIDARCERNQGAASICWGYFFKLFDFGGAFSGDNSLCAQIFAKYF